MSFLRTVRRALLGDSDLPQQCAVGLRGPQLEVRVELQGLRTPRDVTACHMIACASPFTIGVGLSAEWSMEVADAPELSLRFVEAAGDQRLLAEIELRLSSSVPAGTQELFLFEVV